jgi:hypothetical protein
MLLLETGHYGELKEALGAGFPAIFAAIGISFLLVVLAAIPPSALPVTILSDLLAPRRRQVALVGLSICLGTAMGLTIVVWAL